MIRGRHDHISRSGHDNVLDPVENRIAGFGCFPRLSGKQLPNALRQRDCVTLKQCQRFG